MKNLRNIIFEKLKNEDNEIDKIKLEKICEIEKIEPKDLISYIKGTPYTMTDDKIRNICWDLDIETDEFLRYCKEKYYSENSSASEKNSILELGEYLINETKELELKLQNLKSFNNEIADKQRIGFLAGQIQAYKTIYHLFESVKKSHS